MIEQFKLYRKWNELFKIHSLETKVSILTTLFFFILFFYSINIYDNFLLIQNSVTDLILCIIGGEVGLLGITLAGMAIVTGMLDKDTLDSISYIDKNDTVNRVLSSFAFLALNYIIQILYLIAVYFCCISPIQMPNKTLFFAILLVIIYHFSFNIMYTLGLIGNCIVLNEIKNKCNKIQKLDKNINIVANEIRIDYLIANLLNDKEMNREMMLRDLNIIIEKYDYKEKYELINYFKHKYGDS